MNLSDIYSEIITEHNSSNRNKRHVENPTAVNKGVNPSCGDEIELELRVRDGIIEDAAFTGVGCAISQASASIMTDLVRGKKTGEAKRLASLFLGMIKREITDDAALEELDEAVALKNISNMPARVKCATIAWHTLVSTLGDKNDG
jgi:nitrogen fixation NifU-like protein